MVVEEAQYFLLVQGEQTAIGLCNEVLGVMLHKSEQKFRLNHRWRLHLLFYTVPVAVGVADDTENPTHKEKKLYTFFIFPGKWSACCQLMKPELRMFHYIRKFICTDSDEKR